MRLKSDYPKLNFRLGKRFKYRSPRTVYYVEPPEMAARMGDEAEQNEYFLQLLHEVGHALLKHKGFDTDPERLRMECAAWGKAKELCAVYGVDYDEDFAEAELDTYRDWLHQRSLCKECGLTRYQTEDGVYHCPFCGD